MKPNRLFLVTLLGLGLALSTTPVFACDHGSSGGNEGSSSSFFGWCRHFFDSDSHQHDCDHSQNSGGGNNCNHGNGGSSSGGSSGGSTSGTGSTSSTGNSYK
jgi:hypothetical protein